MWTLRLYVAGDSPKSKAAIANLKRLGYVDDERFAKTKALSAAQNKHHGRRRAFMELIKSGVKGEVADALLARESLDGDQVRRMRFDGELLILSTDVRKAGAMVRHTLTWKKLHA